MSAPRQKSRAQVKAAARQQSPTLDAILLPIILVLLVAAYKTVSGT